VKRHEDDPFTLIGINTDDDKDEYRKKCEEFKVTWYSSWQGGGGGPICGDYKVRAFPTFLAIDAKGIIRYRGHSGQQADDMVAELLAEMK
jgi:cytochrome oxidase Cu insertion factor (SCO1/SenC/PrrC family)